MSGARRKVRFPPEGPFYAVLRRRVHAVMAAEGRSRTAGVAGGLTIAAVVAVVVLAYLALLLWVDAAWQVVLVGFVLVQGLVMIGTNVMHESVHDAVSSSPWVNRVLARSLELLGGSQPFWRHKHTVVHHTYTSVVGVDEDIDLGGLLRLHPAQPWRPHQRFQALYFPLLYSLCVLQWFLGDFALYARASAGRPGLPRLSPGDHAIFWLGKALWLALVLIVPMLLHPPQVVLVVALGILLALGFNIALLFQLAHIVDDAVAIEPGEDGTIAHEWAIHQLQTTVNFGTANRLWNVYTGGLSYQVEHHLFPRISHVHYPAISQVVKETCAEFGAPYKEHPKVRAVIGAHVRQLAAMGRPPATARASDHAGAALDAAPIRE
ncbi:MAG: acyl-CoA desaturase [Nannocystaceae bacterium]